MAFRFIFSVYVILHRLPLCFSAGAPGSVAFFLDEQCEQASIINPSVNVPADTCLVTPGALGISVQTLPSCSTGDATLVLYRDTSCANPVGGDLEYHNCYFDGPDGVSAFLFACTGVTGGTRATATSTASAGSSSIPVAGGAPTTTSSGGTSDQTTPSSNGATTTSTPPSSSETNTSSGGAGSGGSGSSSSGSGSGLSQQQQIAIGIIVPVGGIVVALLAWWFPRRRMRRRNEEVQYNLMHRPPQSHQPSTMGIPSSNPIFHELPDRVYGSSHQGSPMWGAQGHESRPWSAR